MDSTHTVIAKFQQPNDAREAMIDLEMKGIDADAIHLVFGSDAPPTNRDVMTSDVDVGHDITMRTVKGGLLGALLGAALLIAVLGAMRVEPLGATLIVGAIAGAAGGAFIGGFWGAVRRLPVNEDVFDTFVPDREGVAESDGVLVEVTVADAKLANDAVAVMRRHHPRQIDREVA